MAWVDILKVLKEIAEVRPFVTETGEAMMGTAASAAANVS